MDRRTRQLFDEQLEHVLAQLPPAVHQLLDQVPLVVEDYPSKSVMRRMRVRRRHHLCGLYTGIPLTQRSIEHSGALSDAVYIFREGICHLAIDRDGLVDDEELRHQIRITILHELGHHHGLDEKQLRDLGYG